MSRLAVLATVLCGVAVALVGCNNKTETLSYERPIRLADLVPEVAAAEDSFALLSAEPTVGRFACRLAVAKFVPGAGDDGALVFVSTRPSEESYWVERMRGVIALQDLIFLRPRSTTPDGQSVETLCATAERLEATLLLVYVPNHTGPNEEHVLGVLFDCAARRPVASLHASARLPVGEDGENAVARAKGDQRARDARVQAQRRFEEYALACVRELTHRDEAPATTQPHEVWDTPFVERWWVNRR